MIKVTPNEDNITLRRMQMIEEIAADMDLQVSLNQISEADAEAWLAARTEEIANSPY